MKLLITGATGLIGTHVTAVCHERGYTVNYLTTDKDKIENKPNHKGFYWNPREGEIDVSCFEGVDAIINLVGANIAKRWTESYKKVIIKSRTETAELLLKSLSQREHNVKHIVSASGISIYPSSLTKFYTEEHKEVDDTFIADVVVKWEAAIDAFETIGIDVAKLRIGLVLAEEDGALPKLAQPVKLGVGAPLGSGKQWQSWIHIDDLARMFVHVVDQHLDGVYNAATSKPQTNKEITQYIAETLNKPLWLPNIPKPVIKLMLGEMATVVLGSQMASNHKIASTGFVYEYHHIKLALEDLLKN
ncbi:MULTISPECIES: TIGR01777 family oxidoreductase [Croceibacter]|mgnify:FL=1|uniref:TIGR01777 family oxidoreductase n=1 Tax=Croceibacter TaxID=216431 RepID=UPI000C6971FA|nr:MULTISPECIES: TIGR01777 family oxidoreductase [Croceibacter]MBG24750.1 TIGR01777 family protein [Croceibacter sp.]|tara:strand:- start:3908 stop:4816 length:909 start_codon:yes stop_codon:yes gene_type:complete